LSVLWLDKELRARLSQIFGASRAYQPRPFSVLKYRYIDKKAALPETKFIQLSSSQSGTQWRSGAEPRVIGNPVWDLWTNVIARLPSGGSRPPSAAQDRHSLSLHPFVKFVPGFYSNSWRFSTLNDSRVIINSGRNNGEKAL
jgi:hypothetical protein